MTRSEFLYRGSPTKNAELFKPKETVGLGDSVKLVVSATPDIATATKFIVPIEKLDVIIGTHKGAHYYICAEKDKFKCLDKGGAIYTLESTGFNQAPELGLEVWVNPNAVIPVSKESVQSGMDAMIEAGVKVVFVSPETFEKLNTSQDNQTGFLETLVFENKK